MADTWSIVFVPYIGAIPTLSSQGVITMTPERLYAFMTNVAVDNGGGGEAAAQADADVNAAVGVVGVEDDVNPPNNNFNNGGLITGGNNGRAAAAVAGADNDGFCATAVVVPTAAADKTAANSYFTTLFTRIEANAVKKVNLTQAVFGAIERRIALTTAAQNQTIPQPGGVVGNAMNAYRASITDVNSFAYVLLLKYPPENNLPAKHSEVYYKKYTQANLLPAGGMGVALAAGAASMLGGLFNVFSKLNLPIAGMNRGGSGHSSILAQYMPQLGRKQSKKHRRKYAKGRTARR